MNVVEKYAKTNKIQPIAITNSHRAYLYEMCNNIIDNNNPNVTVAVHKDSVNIPIQDTNRREYIHIHWFELCTTHLCFHICNDPYSFLKYSIEYSMSDDKTNKKHPIDILYEDYLPIRDMFKNVFNSLSK